MDSPREVEKQLRDHFFPFQHALHDVNFRALRVVHIGHEVVQLRILTGCGNVEQILHHGQRAAVMLNHTS